MASSKVILIILLVFEIFVSLVELGASSLLSRWIPLLGPYLGVVEQPLFMIGELAVLVIVGVIGIFSD